MPDVFAVFLDKEDDDDDGQAPHFFLEWGRGVGVVLYSKLLQDTET